MNWDDGRLFLAVARAGQLLGAARSLGLTQATLSRRMKALEEGLGATLLVRRPHGCALTPAGEALAATLERVEAEFDGASDRIGGEDRRLSGVVRIGAPDGLGVSFIAPRLGLFADRHPGLAIQLVPAPRAFSLSQREADLAVLVGRPRGGDATARRLATYSVGLYASAGYLAEHGVVESAADLARHRLIGFVEDLIYSPDLDYCAALFGAAPARIGITSATGQLAAVAAGAGIGALHDYIAAEAGGLVRVLPERRAEREYWLAIPRSLVQVARVRAAADFLLEQARAARGIFAPAP